MFAAVEFPYWWASLAIGLSVTFLVISFSGRKAPTMSVAAPQVLPAEEDMPWDDLLQLLRAHQQRDTGALPQEWANASPDDLWQRLVCRLPEARNGTTTELKTAPAVEPELPPGAERRTSRRRWSEPVEVQINSQFHATALHGLVVNRSTGGLAILCDAELGAGLIVHVRAVAAPPSVPGAELQVRHAQPAANQWLMGCQYRKRIPWSVKVWFG